MQNDKKKETLEAPNINPGTSRIQNERSIIWVTSPTIVMIERLIAIVDSRNKKEGILSTSSIFDFYEASKISIN